MGTQTLLEAPPHIPAGTVGGWSGEGEAQEEKQPPAFSRPTPISPCWWAWPAGMCPPALRPCCLRASQAVSSPSSRKCPPISRWGCQHDLEVTIAGNLRADAYPRAVPEESGLSGSVFPTAWLGTFGTALGHGRIPSALRSEAWSVRSPGSLHARRFDVAAGSEAACWRACLGDPRHSALPQMKGTRREGTEGRWGAQPGGWACLLGPNPPGPAGLPLRSSS